MIVVGPLNNEHIMGARVLSTVETYFGLGY